MRTFTSQLLGAWSEERTFLKSWFLLSRLHWRSDCGSQLNTFLSSIAAEKALCIFVGPENCGSPSTAMLQLLALVAFGAVRAELGELAAGG